MDELEAGVARLVTFLHRHERFVHIGCSCGWREKDGHTHQDHVAALLMVQKPWEVPS